MSELVSKVSAADTEDNPDETRADLADDEVVHIEEL